MSLQEKFNKLERLTRAAEAGGGQDRIDKQHQAGKKTARERILALLDRRCDWRREPGGRQSLPPIHERS